METETLTPIKKKPGILVQPTHEEYQFLTKLFKAAASKYRKGYPKARVCLCFFKSIIIGAKRPQPYPVAEMIVNMCLAAVRPEDEEGRNQIREIL